ncbi:hypothetical protein A2U01_0075269 [Trifolium medium]|uniref:Uncharacterized protein n=1 Tax=Trifolium medium TaxID=97028 RepID=A0A392SZT2_9FABA|nr:hypothetical protein [Trifolium medium]
MGSQIARELIASIEEDSPSSQQRRTEPQPSASTGGVANP